MAAFRGEPCSVGVSVQEATVRSGGWPVWFSFWFHGCWRALSEGTAWWAGFYCAIRRLLQSAQDRAAPGTPWAFFKGHIQALRFAFGGYLGGAAARRWWDVAARRWWDVARRRRRPPHRDGLVIDGSAAPTPRLPSPRHHAQRLLVWRRVSARVTAASSAPRASASAACSRAPHDRRTTVAPSRFRGGGFLMRHVARPSVGRSEPPALRTRTTAL